MQHYAGIDVSLEWSSVCVVDATGQIIREAKVLSEPEALVAFLLELPVSLARIGLEAGPLSQHLHAALVAAGLASILIETRHVKVALSAMTVKTDRNDARGIAHLMRLGWFRPVHAKTLSAQEVRALLTARKQLQTKLIDLEISLRGILRGFGLKVGTVARGGFEGRIRELVAGQAMLERVAEPMLRARSALRTEFASLHRQLLQLARDNQVCRLLMTTPGVGPVTALTYSSAIDDPGRFRKSKDVGALFGLTPQEVPVRGDRSHRPDQQGRRCHGAHRAVRSGQRHALTPGALLGTQGLGAAGCRPTRDEEGEGGARPQTCRRPASDVGRRHELPMGCGVDGRGLIVSRSRLDGAAAPRSIARSRRGDVGSGEAVGIGVPMSTFQR